MIPIADLLSSSSWRTFCRRLVEFISGCGKIEHVCVCVRAGVFGLSFLLPFDLNGGFSVRCVRLSGLKSYMAKARFAFPGDVKAARPHRLNMLNNSNGLDGLA